MTFSLRSNSLLIQCLAFWALSLLTAVSDAAPPNVILFVTDDQSPDIGAYGNTAIKTPSMDELAADGVRFPNAFCTTASCSASRSVILSGLHNHHNGQYGHQHAYHHFSAFDYVKSLPVRISEAGYESIRIGKYHVAPESVFQFDHELKANARNPVQMAETVGAYLDRRDNTEPFFLYFCTSDPHRSGGRRDDLEHAPNPFGNKQEGYPGVESVYYDPAEVIVPSFLPDTPVARAEIAMYYESISRIDQGLGKLVKELKARDLYDNTAIIFTSDHGMAFPGAKTNLYEPGMRVPMIVRHPAIKDRGTVNDALVSHVDLAPTILEMADASKTANPKKAFHGRSWLPVLLKPGMKGWNEVFASHTFHEIQMYYPMKVVRGRKYKLIWNVAHQLPYPFASDLWAAPTWKDRYEKGMETKYGLKTVGQYIQRERFELFDIENDPDETTNLAEKPEHSELLQQMKDKLKQYQKKTKDPWIIKWDYE